MSTIRDALNRAASEQPPPLPRPSREDLEATIRNQAIEIEYLRRQLAELERVRRVVRKYRELAEEVQV